MKPKTDLIVNAICLLIVSPILGMMVVGIIVCVLDVLIITIATVAGAVSSIFFEINFESIFPRIESLRKLEMWFIVGAGSIGGIIWSCSEIKNKWRTYKETGKGWTI